MLPRARTHRSRAYSSSCPQVSATAACCTSPRNRRPEPEPPTLRRHRRTSPASKSPSNSSPSRSASRSASGSPSWSSFRYSRGSGRAASLACRSRSPRCVQQHWLGWLPIGVAETHASLAPHNRSCTRATKNNIWYRCSHGQLLNGFCGYLVVTYCCVLRKSCLAHK